MHHTVLRLMMTTSGTLRLLRKRNIMKCNTSLFSLKVFWFYSLLFTVQYLFYSKSVNDITFEVFKSRWKTAANIIIQK